MIAAENKYTNISGTHPNALLIDASGVGTTDGSEYAALPQNDGWDSVSQAIMAYMAGGTNAPTGTAGTPNGVSEAAAVSQIIQALQLSNGVGPGKGVIWFGDDDPSVTGDRVLLLQGQGVLIASYPDLDAKVYVGNTANPTVAAGGGKFYRSSDSGGATPNTAGPYLQLPEARGYTLRGLDLAAAVDPLGAARFLGDNQADAMQRITGFLEADRLTQPVSTQGGVLSQGTSALLSQSAASGTVTSNRIDFDSANSTSPNAAKTDDVETRMANLSIKLGITY